MGTANKRLPPGWGRPLVSRKWHYFPAGETFALCGRIGFYFAPRKQGQHESTEHCAECKRRLAKLKEVTT